MTNETKNTSKPPLIWLNLTIFAATFIFAVVVAPWYGFSHGYTSAHWIWLLIAFSFCNLAITAGYHRLWSHKAYQAHSAVRFIFAIGGAFALQNSILHWSSDHRVHHKHVDNNDKDPYSAKRGFWFSHMGWMLRNYNQDVYADYANCRDLQKDKIVMWQHKYYVPLALATNFGIPLLLGIVYGDIWGMLLMVGVVRLFLSHHSTFFINSLAHIWGSQPYTDKNTSRDNAILAVFTFGEGYHNYHHIFENDYRNGIYWWQYDPTKWLIKGLEYCNLASKLRKAPMLKVEEARAKMAYERALRKVAHMPNCQQLMEQMKAEFDTLVSHMREYYALKKQLLESKRDDMMRKYEYKLLQLRIEQAKQAMIEKQQAWQALTHKFA